MRKSPLKRTKGLKPSALKRGDKVLKRFTRIKQVGKRATARAPWMARCRAAVMSRAAVMMGTLSGEPLYVRCEACEVVLFPESAHWHHVFGRSLGLKGAARWCHVKELTLILCPTCHERVTNPANEHDHKLAERQRALATIRLAQRLGIGRASVIRALANDPTPIALVRMLIAQHGWPPEPVEP